MRAIIFLIFQIPFAVFAFKQNDLNLHVGPGIGGTRGVTGISLEKFLTPNHALMVATGVDIIGMPMSLGYRYMWNPYNQADRDKWYGKCLFLFECDDHLYVGIQGQYVNTSEITVRENTNTNIYQMDARTFGMIVVGDRNRFTTDVTLDFELSYRSLVSGGGSRITSGAAGATTEPSSGTGIGFGIAVGYNF